MSGNRYLTRGSNGNALSIHTTGNVFAATSGNDTSAGTIDMAYTVDISRCWHDHVGVM